MKSHFRIYLLPIACITAFLLLACGPKHSTQKQAATSPTPAPTPKPKPFVAYLKDGDLWAIRSDGTDERVLAVSAEGQTIQDFVWSVDGSRVYYVVGLKFYEVVVANGNIASAGELTAPPGVTIDRVEIGSDGGAFAINAIDADTFNRLYAVTIGQSEARELTIDRFNDLIPLRPPVVKTISDVSVSPDSNWMLFKDVVGAGEELFIASVETGARIQVTNLYQLGGFEASAEIEGGRRIMEAAWSADGRYIVFNPIQYCSEIGLCSGRLFLVEAFGGAQLQLSIDMMVSIPNGPNGWTSEGNLLVYDDGSRVVVADTQGFPKALTEGHHPKWQPVQ